MSKVTQRLKSRKNKRSFLHSSLAKFKDMNVFIDNTGLNHRKMLVKKSSFLQHKNQNSYLKLNVNILKLIIQNYEDFHKIQSKQSLKSAHFKISQNI